MASYLQQLDATKADLMVRYPGWQVWYVPNSTHPGATWCARPHPLLNEASPEYLAQAIEQSDRERDATALTRSTTRSIVWSEQA